MANTFKNYFLISSNTASNLVVGPAATQTTIIGMTVANVTDAPILANVVINSSGTDYSLVYNSEIPVGSTLVPIGSLQKLVLESGDFIQVETTSDAHVIASGIEITN
jgi:hypothetical protein